MQRIAVKERQIGVLALRKAAEAAVDAADTGRIDGNRTQRRFLPHPLLGRQRRAERQILNARHRMIGGQRDQYAGLVKHACGFEIRLIDLDFVARGQRRPDNGRKAARGDLSGDQMSLRAVVERQPEAELLGDADRGKDVVGSVRMRL